MKVNSNQTEYRQVVREAKKARVTFQPSSQPMKKPPQDHGLIPTKENTKEQAPTRSHSHQASSGKDLCRSAKTVSVQSQPYRQWKKSYTTEKDAVGRLSVTARS